MSKNKLYFSVITIAAILGFGVMSCKKDVTGVTLDQPTATLAVGKTLTLVATVLPDKAANKKVTWKSDNEKVARVNNGIVNAISEGMATITVTTDDGNKAASCVVRVVSSTLLSITFPTGTLIIDLGDEVAALQNVTAKGANGNDITDSLTIAGLNFVGKGELIYTAKDTSGTESKTRPVIIKSDKLFGTYFVKETNDDGYTDFYTVTVTASDGDVTKLVINNFWGEGFTAVFEGNGKSTTLTMVPFSATFGEWTANLTGTATYKKSATNDYVIYECKTMAVWNDGDVDNYTAIFERY
jgi:hypothetical protein